MTVIRQEAIQMLEKVSEDKKAQGTENFPVLF